MELVKDVSVKQLLEIASENVPPRNKSSNVSLTPLQSSSATNTEEALRLNKRRSRLTLQKRQGCSHVSQQWGMIRQLKVSHLELLLGPYVTQ